MDTAVASILTGAGVAGVWVICFLVGLCYPKSVVADLKAENAELKASRDAERERGDAAITAASATKDILAAIQFGQHATGPPGNS